MIYRDLPVFVGLANQPPSTINNNYYLMASQVSISMAAGAEAKRKINQPIDQYDQFTHSDPLLCRISLQSYVPGSIVEAFNPSDLATPIDLSWAAKIILNQSTGNNYHPIRIGGNVFDKCYLDSYTIDISPLKPVTLSAEFVCNNPPTGSGILSFINGVDSFIGTKNFSDKIIHGHTCTISGADNVVSNIQSSIKYQVTCDRTPVYTIGSVMPSLMMLDRVERQMDIESTDINKIINQEGSTLIKPISVGLRYEKDYSITAYLNMNAGSKLLSQKISMQEADTLSTQVSIKEILNADKDTLSFPIIIEDYNMSVSSLSVNEGGTVTFTISTTGVPNGTNLYYSVENITTIDTDFDGPIYGSVTINNNQGTFSISIKADFTTEGASETFKVIVTNPIFEKILESGIITVADTSLTPTYTLSGNPNPVNENGTVVFTITTNLPNGSVLGYGIQHITTNDADFIGSTSGNVTINGGTGTFSVAINPDSITEGSQTFKGVIKNSSLQVVKESAEITINDTSISLAPTYIVSSDTVFVDEGGTVTFTITTTNVPNGTYLYYKKENISTSNNDFTGNTSGQVAIISNTGTFTITTAADSLSETATEDFRVDIYTDSSYTTLVETSETIAINNLNQIIYPTPTWVQKGAVLTAEVNDDVAGYGVSISKDGNVVVSAGGDQETLTRFIRVDKWVSATSSWSTTKISIPNYGTINGMANSTTEFTSIIETSISNDGNVIAFTYRSFYGQLQPLNSTPQDFAAIAGVYYWSGTQWVLRGSYFPLINHVASNICLSGDGSVVAISEGGPNMPTKVYKWNGTDWLQLGNALTSDLINSGTQYFGNKISLDYTGNTIALVTLSVGAGADIYKFINNAWTSLNFRTALDQFDYNSSFIGNMPIDQVKLNGVGNIAVVAGYSLSLNPQIFVLKWNGSSWNQLGTSFNTSGSQFGSMDYTVFGDDMSISIDDTASRIIWSIRLVSSQLNTSIGNSMDSVIRVVDWNGSNWSQVSSISPSPTNSNNGFSIALSADGKTMVFGAPNYRKATVYTTNT